MGFVIWVDEDACPIGRRLLYRFCMHLSACVCLRARFGDNVLLRVFVCVRVCVLNSLVLRCVGRPPERSPMNDVCTPQHMAVRVVNFNTSDEFALQAEA